MELGFHILHGSLRYIFGYNELAHYLRQNSDKRYIMKKNIRNFTIVIIVLAMLSISLVGCISSQPNVENETIIDNLAGGLDQEDIGETQEDGTPVLDEEIQIAVETYIRAKIGSINVRSGKGSNYYSLGTLDKGDMLEYVAESDGWYTTYFRNRIAYVSCNSLYTELFDMETSEIDVIEQVIEVGTRVLGTPYVYGATRLHNGNGVLLSGFSVNAFDCSSLMQYMFYYGASINLQVNTRTQIYQGSYVSKADLKRGDLMFFTNSSRYYNTGIERVGHVAIYLGGNYILQTASDHAVIEQISSLRWSYFIEGRRMI